MLIEFIMLVLSVMPAYQLVDTMSTKVVNMPQVVAIFPQLEYDVPIDAPPQVENKRHDALVTKLSTSDMECLRSNIYWEARNQSTKGKELVAIVTLNRVKRKAFPNSVCKVVQYSYKGSYAFSWYGDGRSDKPNLKDVGESKAWKECMRVARNVSNGIVTIQPDSPLLQADHYHRDDVSPYWAPKLTKLGNIGVHIAYKG